ncbi:MAG: 2-succinyl-5-enolpyruvyl-6-hydroxy-3-cyclohexene-1-carboxylic-acid synthase [Muribaculaceae bacterium]|nr:2-succinyl-5-enolpyruvyl-6-hydroxy-3-cyclohexene-1-carboxylic-acid synthase [Muribaculaceae bacterium]
MIDTSKKFCSILLDVLEAQGVCDVVCSPGSRNVPLLIAAAAREGLKKHFAVDERSAGFMGLGLALVKNAPVALICTSGTALLNYAPAVAEAYYQGIPLIVISADRPIQWIDQDDSQTLRQDGALDNFVKKSFSIPANGEDTKEMLWYVERIANEAMITAASGKKGPVHINVHLSEPLNEKVKCGRNPAIIRNLESDSFANKEVIKELATEIAESKVMLVAGFNQPDSALQKVITEFSRFPNVVVMAETISNLHLDYDNYAVDSVLTAYSPEELDRYAPQLVISIGGSLVSRKLKEYLRRNSNNCRHWSVGYSHTLSDPFQSLSTHIECNPYRFFRAINSVLRKRLIAMPHNSKDSSLDLSGFSSDIYRNLWHELRIKALDIKNSEVRKAPWSELLAFQMILNDIPTSYNLFLSNGTAIRYAQIINYPLPHASYCNRGVSGIDGSLSTAIGGAIAFKESSLLVTGDLSMAYDIGALGLRNIPERFKVIVIDNQGGGIFRFIPSTSDLEGREEYLCQPPLLPLKDLAHGYGWNYFDAFDEKSLASVLPDFFTSPRKAILKVTCDGQVSAKILKSYFAQKV